MREALDSSDDRAEALVRFVGGMSSAGGGGAASTPGHPATIVVVLLAVAARSWVDRSPVLGLAAWYAALFSVTAALGLAALALVIPWPRTIDVPCALWSWCADALRGEYGLLGHVAGTLVVGRA